MCARRSKERVHLPTSTFAGSALPPILFSPKREAVRRTRTPEGQHAREWLHTHAHGSTLRPLTEIMEKCDLLRWASAPAEAGGSA